MSYQFEKSAEAFDSRYNIFTAKPVNTATKQEHFIDFRPVNQFGPNQVIEFNAPNTSLYYTDLSRTKLQIKLRILNEDLTPINATSAVGLTNNNLHSIFRQVDVCLQQQNISPEIGFCYPYKAIIDALCSQTSTELESKFGSELFYKDTPGYMDSTDTAGVSNAGLAKRWGFTSEGKNCMIEGVLKMDIFGISNFIINGVNLNIQLYPSKSSFSLMSSDEKNYVIDITDANLKVCYIQPSNPLIIGHSEALERTPAIYPFIKSTLKSHTIASGVQNWSIDQMFSDNIPNVLYIVMVTSESFNGNYKKNPFHFQHFNLDFLCLYIEGTPVNQQAFLPNFDKDQFTNEYRALFENNKNTEIGNIIKYSDFKLGYTIYKINISNGIQHDYDSLKRQGQTRLSLRFTTPLTSAITVICYGQSPHVLQIYKARNIIV